MPRRSTAERSPVMRRNREARGQHSSSCRLRRMLHAVGDAHQIANAGPSADLLQDVVQPAAAVQPADFAVGIVEIAKNDRARWTRLLARGLDAAVIERSPFLFRG